MKPTHQVLTEAAEILEAQPRLNKTGCHHQPVYDDGKIVYYEHCIMGAVLAAMYDNPGYSNGTPSFTNANADWLQFEYIGRRIVARLGHTDWSEIYYWNDRIATKEEAVILLRELAKEVA